MSKRMSLAGLDLLKNFEGLRLAKYRDPAGFWTIGYGHLIKPGECFDEPISEEAAVGLLREDVTTAENAVNRLVTIELTQFEFDALVSFVYNIGCTAFGDSTLLKKLNQGHKMAAAAEFSRWNKATIDGALQPLDGLTRRRELERLFFLRDESKDS